MKPALAAVFLCAACASPFDKASDVLDRQRAALKDDVPKIAKDAVHEAVAEVKSAAADTELWKSIGIGIGVLGAAFTSVKTVRRKAIEKAVAKKRAVPAANGTSEPKEPT